MSKDSVSAFTGADVAVYLKKMPKTDLHVHLIGSVRAETFRELCAKNSVDLPVPANELFARVNTVIEHPDGEGEPLQTMTGPMESEPLPLLRLYELICESLRDREDFARVAYEALEDGYRSSNVVYQELAFSPGIHAAHGVAYRTQVDGLVDGLDMARHDFGTDGAFIAAVNREDSVVAAEDMLALVLADRRDDVIAIGIDFHESSGVPEKFASVFQRAESAGLHRTAHASEHIPSAHPVATCLDDLKCERIDHGYFILKDANVVKRCRDEGIHFNVITTSSLRSWVPWRKSSIKEMLRQGLEITLNSDDPQLFPTTVAAEYRIAHDDLGLTIPQIEAINLAGVSGSFLDRERKARLRQQFVDYRSSEATPP